MDRAAGGAHREPRGDEAQDGAAAAGVARDGINFAAIAADAVLACVQGGVNLGFSVGSAVASTTANAAVAGAAAVVAMGVAGEASDSAVTVAVLGAALCKAAEVGVTIAHASTAAGVGIGRVVTSGALQAADSVFESYGVPNGVAVRLAFGEDTGRALQFISRVAQEIGGLPPPGMSMADVARAATALNWLQQTAAVVALGTRGRGLPSPPWGASLPAADADVGGVDIDGAAPRYLRFALAAYGHVALKFLGLLPVMGPAVTDDAAVLETLTGGAEVVLADWAGGSVYRPGHALLVDAPGNAVVLVFRGTLGIHDVLTDLVCQQRPVEIGGVAGEAHGGMLEATRRLVQELRPSIEAALRANPTHRLVLCGHSLGAGLATLVAALLGPTIQVPLPDGGQLTAAVVCFAFAPPAVLSVELAREARHVTSVVRGADMVPRFGMATTMDLRASIAALHASPGLIDEIEARAASAQAMAPALEGAEPVRLLRPPHLPHLWRPNCCSHARGLSLASGRMR